MVFDGRYCLIGLFVGPRHIFTAGVGAVVIAVALVRAVGRMGGSRELRHVDVAARNVLNRWIVRLLQGQRPVGIRDDESGDFHYHTVWVWGDADRVIGTGTPLGLCRHCDSPNCGGSGGSYWTETTRSSRARGSMWTRVTGK